MSARCDVFLVADDLTGAADAAVAFAARGRDTRIVLEPLEATKGTAEVVAISIESRDVPEEELPSRNAPLYRAIQDDVVCFRKIDSMFRGNTFVEIALLARAQPDVPIVLAPAYPALGRRLLLGEVHWDDHVQQGRFSVEEPLQQRGVTCVRVPVERDERSLSESLRSYQGASPTVFLCEANTQQDLNRTVEEGLAAKCPVIWTGSGGLALSLAAQISPSLPTLRKEPASKATVVFFIGSDHPVTQRQLQHLHSICPDTAIIIPVMRGYTSASEIQAEIDSLPRHKIGCVFMTGGETAMFVCRALGAQSLIVESEVAPGVPRTRICGGILDGVDAVLKSGGFGEPDLLCHIAQQYASRKDVT